MNVEKIQAALQKQKGGLDTTKLVDDFAGRRFKGCALGALFHACGKTRKQIQENTTATHDYKDMFDGLLAREYGLEDEEIDRIHLANDNFQYQCVDYGSIRLRDYMILWVEKFAEFLSNFNGPESKYQKTCKADEAARKAVGCDF